MGLRDESHTLFGTVVDSDDSGGVWIALPADKQEPDDAVGRISLLIPWSQVFTIVVAEHFSAANRQEARRIGFTGETEKE